MRTRTIPIPGQRPRPTAIIWLSAGMTTGVVPDGERTGFAGRLRDRVSKHPILSQNRRSQVLDAFSGFGASAVRVGQCTSTLPVVSVVSAGTWSGTTVEVSASVTDGGTNPVTGRGAAGAPPPTRPLPIIRCQQERVQAPLPHS